MLQRLSRLTTAHAWEICAAWIIAGVALTCYAPNWDSKAQDDDIRFLPDRCASVRGYLLLQKAFPKDIFASRAIFAVERPDGPLTAGDYALVDQLAGDLERLAREEPELHIGTITSYRNAVIGKRFISADQKCTLIQAALKTPFLAVQTRATVDRAEAVLKKRLVGHEEHGADAPRSQPHVFVTGPAGLGRDLIRASADGLDRTTLATVGLVIVVLLLVYRAPLLALVPLATIAASVWVSLQLLALLTLLPGVHLVNISKVFAIVILYGAGTDYCLFLISRYREELSHSTDYTDDKCGPAIRSSVQAVGGALTASAGTVICGLGLMGFAEFAKVRCAGPAIALSLAVALLASLTLAPALLHLLGRAVFWPAGMPSAKPRDPGRERPTSFWERMSRLVVARPLLVWTGAVSLLAPLALIGLGVSPNYKSTGELPPSADSIQGVAAIQRHFTAGEIGPLTVLLSSSTDWSTPAGRDLIAHLSRGFALLPNVAEVRSLTQPLGAPVSGVGDQESGVSQKTTAVVLSPDLSPLTPSRATSGGFLNSLRKGIDGIVQHAADQAAREHYVAAISSEQGRQFVTRLDVVFRADPFEASSMGTLTLIQTWLHDALPRSASRLRSVNAECYGATVSAHDLAEITEADRVRVNGLVLAGIFVILLVLVRRPWLAAYLLITVLFSYYAALGATVLAGTLWSGRPLFQVEWRVPFFLFTILIAVGEDYNIFLITRVLHERNRRGAQEGTRRALARTGGTITSCGLIMAGTFGTLMLAGLGTLMQIGFALAFGVLLDTFVVRPFLVPAFTLLVWRDKWQNALSPPRLDDRSAPTRLAG
jgi:RND superfamily putative drug exporter